MRRRWRFLRAMGCDWLTAAVIALLNELSDLPPHEVGFMHLRWDMRRVPTPNTTEGE